MSQLPAGFGKYLLVEQIGLGATSDVFRARLQASNGRFRVIAIKRIHSQYGSASGLFESLKPDLHRSLRLNHPSIVCLYDFGVEESYPFIVMEMVEGPSLKQLKELDRELPIELATFIIEQTAAGLHYLHTFKDRLTGEPNEILHGKISPKKILISKEGLVKLLPSHYSIKVPYLPPEYTRKEKLTNRSDIFSLGIVFWELLTGRKLFDGRDDLDILKKIEACEVVLPSKLNKNVPPELDQIVMKCLAKEQQNRYSSAELLQRDLHRFIYSYKPEFNPLDLVAFLNEIPEFEEQLTNESLQVDQDQSMIALDQDLVVYLTKEAARCKLTVSELTNSLIRENLKKRKPLSKTGRKLKKKSSSKKKK